MENDKISIILLVVIVILLLAGLMLFGPFAKKDVNLQVTTAGSLHDGDNFGISLKSVDGTPIANARVDVTIIDANGGKNPQVITTDGNGEGLLQLNGLAPGKYNVELSYSGSGEYNSNQTGAQFDMNAATTSVSSDGGGSSGGQTVTLDLNSYDTYATKNVGEYKIQAMKWKGTTVGGLGVWVYKNGQQLDSNSYSSRGYICMDGNWKWTEWAHGESGGTYHKYPVSNDVQIEKVEVSF